MERNREPRRRIWDDAAQKYVYVAGRLPGRRHVRRPPAGQPRKRRIWIRDERIAALPEITTEAELADALGLSVSLIRHWRFKGYLEPVASASHDRRVRTAYARADVLRCLVARGYIRGADPDHQTH